MKEYIDRDALVGAFLDKNYSSTESKIEYGDAILLVQKQPKADVQEVIRCGKCKNHRFQCGFLWCTLHMTKMNSDDFCSYGAKMDKE